MTRVPLAWRNATADPRRLARAAAGIAFAILLVLVELGFQAAFIDSALEVIRRLDGQLVMVGAGKERWTKSAPFALARLEQALAVPGVARTAPLYRQDGPWKNPSDRSSGVMQVLAFDPDRPVFLLPEATAGPAVLKQPGTVLVDRRSRRFLGPGSPGMTTELGRREVRIAGTFALGPDFIVDGTVLTSDRTFKTLFPDVFSRRDGRTVELGLISLAPGADAATVRRDLAALLPDDVRLLTRDEILALETEFQANTTSVGPIFSMGVVVGFVVGLLICYQILYSELSDQLPQYATLKAMGYGNRSLLAVVVQQALLYAVAGFVPALLLGIGLFAVLGEASLLPMRVTAATAVTGLAVAAAMCLAAGLLAVRRVMAADPAELF